jgi:predicted nucleotidyltransferase
MESIRRVVLFGSTVSGIPTPRSDADLLVEVTSSPHAHPRHRIPEVLLAFSPLPCPVDLLVLTTDEIARERAGGSPLLETVFGRGLVLFER